MTNGPPFYFAHNAQGTHTTQKTHVLHNVYFRYRIRMTTTTTMAKMMIAERITVKTMTRMTITARTKRTNTPHRHSVLS